MWPDGGIWDGILGQYSQDPAIHLQCGSKCESPPSHTQMA